MAVYYPVGKWTWLWWYTIESHYLLKWEVIKRLSYCGAFKQRRRSSARRSRDWRLNLKSVAWRRKLSYIFLRNLFFRPKTKWILFASKQRLVKKCGSLKDEIPSAAKLNSRPKWVLITCHKPSSIMSHNSNNPIIPYDITQRNTSYWTRNKHTWASGRQARTESAASVITGEIRKVGLSATFDWDPNSNGN